MPYPKVTLSDLYGATESYFERHELDEKLRNAASLLQECEHRLGRTGRILDVGCGRGEIASAAMDANWTYDGFDPSEEFVRFAAEELGVTVRCGTLDDFEYPKASYDIVIMGGIIEHLYDPASVLLQIHNLLAPRGWLYFDAPNEDGLYMSIGNAYMRLRGRDQLVVMAPTFSPFHVQGFNPRSLRAILKNTGFSIESMEVRGVVSPQTGVMGLQKKVEYWGATVANWLGNIFGRGTYMFIWAQKEDG